MKRSKYDGHPPSKLAFFELSLMRRMPRIWYPRRWQVARSRPMQRVGTSGETTRKTSPRLMADRHAGGCNQQQGMLDITGTKDNLFWCFDAYNYNQINYNHLYMT